MASRVKFICPAGQWFKAQNDWEKILAHAATTSVKNTAIKARDAARSKVGSAGFGTAWTKAIVSSMHPKRGEVLNPWAWVHSTINFSGVFEADTSFGPKARRFLWIPTDIVPKYPGTGKIGEPTRQMNPKLYARLVGPLQFIHPPGKSAMLLAKVAIGRGGRTSVPFLPLPGMTPVFKGRAAKQQKRMVVAFIGVPRVTLEKRFDTYATIINQIKDLPLEYEKAITEAQK